MEAASAVADPLAAATGASDAQRRRVNLLTRKLLLREMRRELRELSLPTSASAAARRQLVKEDSILVGGQGTVERFDQPDTDKLLHTDRYVKLRAAIAAAASQRQRRTQQMKQQKRVAFTDGSDPINEAVAGALVAKQLHGMLGYKQVGRAVCATREQEIIGAFAGDAADEHEEELEQAEQAEQVEQLRAQDAVDGQRSTQPTHDDEQPEEEEDDDDDDDGDDGTAAAEPADADSPLMPGDVTPAAGAVITAPPSTANVVMKEGQLRCVRLAGGRFVATHEATNTSNLTISFATGKGNKLVLSVTVEHESGVANQRDPQNTYKFKLPATSISQIERRVSHDRADGDGVKHVAFNIVLSIKSVQKPKGDKSKHHNMWVGVTNDGDPDLLCVRGATRLEVTFMSAAVGTAFMETLVGVSSGSKYLADLVQKHDMLSFDAEFSAAPEVFDGNAHDEILSSTDMQKVPTQGNIDAVLKEVSAIVSEFQPRKYDFEKNEWVSVGGGWAPTYEGSSAERPKRCHDCSCAVSFRVPGLIGRVALAKESDISERTRTLNGIFDNGVACRARCTGALGRRSWMDTTRGSCCWTRLASRRRERQLGRRRRR